MAFEGLIPMHLRFVFIWISFALVTLVLAPDLWCHGIAGKRFFPTTLAIEDPAVSDEFSTLFRRIKEPAEREEPSTLETELSGEYSKRVTPNLALSIGSEFRRLKPAGGETQKGFGNLEVGAKYEFFNNAVHETILSFGVEAELGGTGSKKAGAESFSTISPALFFGKGLGDLPEGMKYLKPLAITGLAGLNFPSRSKDVTLHDEEIEIERHPITFSWGGTIQYNLQYLQSYVKDVGLPLPLSRMIAIVEVPLETCLNRGCGGEITGSVNPGLIWFGRSVQIGMEAVIPINSRSGKKAGVVGLVHFFVDDIFPKSLGRPIFR
jgi:hypothetical protein